MAGIEFLKRLLGGGATDTRQLEPVLQAPLDTRMLVVDDSPTVRAALGRMLVMDGYAVLRAVDGESAIERARTELPALIFLDIVLPGINGFAVLRALRHDPLTQHIPIVMISGNQQATEQFYVQRFGADDFIRKPFGQPEVGRCIHRLVASGRLVAREAVPVAAEPALVTELVAVPGLAA